MKMKIRRKTTLSILLITALVIVVPSGCTSTKQDTAVSEKNGITTSPVAMTNYKRGISVKQTPQKTPQKVLTLGPNCTELFAALGLTDRIIGTSLNNHSRGWLPEYTKLLSDIPELNHGSATREAVISSGADFIYGIDWEFGADALDVDELHNYGIDVYINAAATVEEQYKEITDLGSIFGIEDTAAAYVEDQKARIKTVQDRTKESEPLKVLIYDSGGEGIFTCSGSNLETYLIELAGGENIFHDITEKAWVTVGYEEVLRREPDIILIHDYDSPSVAAKIAEIEANDTLSQLECVKNQRFAVIELEGVLPGSRMADTVEKLSAAFYPD